MRHRHAFTIIELLVVVSLLVLLIALLLPTLSSARDSARTAVCMSNMRQIGAAWLTYTDDHQGRIMGAHTHRPNYDWVYTPPAPTLPPNELPSNIRNGVMFPYLNDVSVYKCPADPRRDYLRTYSMTNHFGGTPDWHINPLYKFEAEPNPQQRLVFVEEPDPRGYNWGAWVIYPQGHAQTDRFIDWPASYHPGAGIGGSTLVFADAHVEHWQWEDPRTQEIAWFSTVSPNNTDLHRLQAVYSPPQ